jgi:hypothetical protein
MQTRMAVMVASVVCVVAAVGCPPSPVPPTPLQPEAGAVADSGAADTFVADTYVVEAAPPPPAACTAAQLTCGSTCCGPYENATPLCISGLSCAYSCNPGWLACSWAWGCFTPSDTANCGNCGVACPGGWVCQSNVCVIPVGKKKR